MKLVIVESPAKAKTINKYLGKDFKVLASFGHIRDLPAKDGSVRPDEDFAMDYEISAKSSKHVKEISDAAKKAEAIYLATDPDREGEAISWHVIEYLKSKKALPKAVKVYRSVFNEITKRAVNEAINNPRDLDMDLVNAQQARRALDYLVGFNLSPILWRKLPGSKSAGRVQSVALRLICEREGEIENFVAREYWDIKLDLQTESKKDFTARITHIEGKKLEQFDVVTEKEAGSLVDKLQKKKYSVVDIEKKQSRRNPQPPFTTSSLQQEASRKLGYGAKRTMQIAQRLYEGVDLDGETVGLITYMRTDGVTVAQEAISATRSLIESKYGDEYVPSSQRMYTAKAKNSQEAHEAIRPTDVKRTPEEVKQYLEDEQYKLYDLIWKRMVASQMESAVLDQVAVTIKSDDNYANARANGSTINFDGFYKVYREGFDDKDDDDDDRILPPMDRGENLGLNGVNPEQHFTQAPPRYTEASLVKKLEELGIGRPSTYASIISVLQEREYVRLEKKRFMTENRGRIVTAFLISFFKRYVEYDFTAKLEDELDEVSEGKINWKKLLGDFWKDFNGNIEDVKELTMTEVIRELNQLLGNYLFPKNEKGEIDRSCPACDDGRLSLKMGKFGSFLGCSNYPDCKYTKQLGTESADGGEESNSVEQDGPKVLGKDDKTGMEITLRKGPYGYYFQLGEAEGKNKPKRAALPKGTSPADATLEIAKGLLSLPRIVGVHPETGKEITAGIGRFGPYLNHDGVFVSLKGDDDVLTIGINRAVTLIAEKKPKKAAEPLRIVGQHPETGENIELHDGRYGPYVKCGKSNASLAKGMEIDSVTVEDAIKLLKKKPKGKKK